MIGSATSQMKETVIEKEQEEVEHCLLQMRMLFFDLSWTKEEDFEQLLSKYKRDWIQDNWADEQMVDSVSSNEWIIMLFKMSPRSQCVHKDVCKRRESKAAK